MSAAARRAPRDDARAIGQSRSARMAIRAVVVLIATLWTMPSAGVLISSLRPADDVATSGWWTAVLHPFEATWTLANYHEVLTSEGMLRAFVNSAVVTVPATIMPMAVASFGAYALARMSFRGRATLLGLVVGLLVVPIQMTLVPLLSVYNATGLTGTYLGVWLAHAGFGLPLALYLLYIYMADLPDDVFEAAHVDGASHLDSYLHLALPLSVPALAAFAIFQFLWTWNDLLVALVFLGTGRDVAVVTARLNELAGTRGQDWHLLTAGAFVTIAVPLAVFLSFQRYFVRGILAGSVKE